MSANYYEGIGRRKESTARVRIMSGSGNFIINDKPATSYLSRYGDIEIILTPLEITGENPSNLDISVVVKGGGVTGQVDAVQLGLARALLVMNPDYRPALRKEKLLTRDARIKERKKPGLKRARKAPTYTKR